MKEVFPNYYSKFVCIADRCTHNCCIGWEIDIDAYTMNLYNCLDTEIGARIRENIDGDTPHFVLEKDGRCPFLNEKGLCDIICQLGEDALCDICYMHPRFKNFYSSFSETGLGLCCEEAVRLILSDDEVFSVPVPAGVRLQKKEKAFFAKREQIFDILQNREKSIYKRFSDLAEAFGMEFRFSLDKLIDMYLPLERLDEKWTEELCKIKGVTVDDGVFEDADLQIPFEQLAVYFIFRHLKDALPDGDYIWVVRFALVSCYLVGALCSYYKAVNGSVSFEQMCEIVRMYSSEIEYSDENILALKNARE